MNRNLFIGWFVIVPAVALAFWGGLYYAISTLAHTIP